MKKFIIMLVLFLFILTTVTYAQSNVVNKRRMSVYTMDSEDFMEAEVFETGVKFYFDVETDRHGVDTDTIKYLINRVKIVDEITFEYEEYKREEKSLDELMIDQTSFGFSEVINEPGIYTIDIYLDLDQYSSLIIMVVNDKDGYNGKDFIDEGYIRGW